MRQAVVGESGPDAAFVVLVDSIGLVAGQPLVLANTVKLCPENGQAVTPAGPEIAFAILKEA